MGTEHVLPHIKRKSVRYKNYHNEWITNGIKIACIKKRELFKLSKHSNDLDFKIYFKQYWKSLSKVILAAKNYIITESLLNPIIK
jgi:hypothetical protein